jgi:hypothetical protein
MTPKPRKSKSKCKDGQAFARRMKAARAAAARRKRPAKPRKAPRTASGPVKVESAALGEVHVLTLKRGDKSFMHVFNPKSTPTVHQVEGQPGVLVLRGAFRIDGQGFIHNT